MTFAEAIHQAILVCDQAGRQDVSKVLAELPHYRIANRVNHIHRTLRAVGINLTEILNEVKDAKTHEERIAANAKLEMALKVIDAKDRGA